VGACCSILPYFRRHHLIQQQHRNSLPCIVKYRHILLALAMTKTVAFIFLLSLLSDRYASGLVVTTNTLRRNIRVAHCTRGFDEATGRFVRLRSDTTRKYDSSLRMCSPFAPFFDLKRPFSGLVTDWRRRFPHYKSDWTDGLTKRSFGATVFLYVACLAPTVAFGGLVNIITEGSMGVIEFLVSTGLGGVIYAIFSGQPMTFLGPTGLTLAFTGALYTFTKAAKLPFLPMYSWIGMWTSLFLALSAIFNLSYYIRFCTRFTDDSFNAILAMNFLYEAVRYENVDISLYDRMICVCSALFE
jgi:HCO3- transporter family